MAVQTTRMQALIGQMINYDVTSDALLLEALDTTGMRVAQSNQRLALLGDAVLKHILLDDWYPTGRSKGDSSDH